MEEVCDENECPLPQTPLNPLAFPFATAFQNSEFRDVTSEPLNSNSLLGSNASANYRDSVLNVI